jgi:hypothetical protein
MPVATRYLQQIAAFPMLTPREERQVCRGIEAARQALAAALVTLPHSQRQLADLSDASSFVSSRTI